MKNLKHSFAQCESLGKLCGLSCKFCLLALNPDTADVVYTCSEDGSLAQINTTSHHHQVVSLKEFGIMEKPIFLDCVRDLDCWLSVCTNHTICKVKFDEYFLADPQFELIGNFEQRLLEVSWSPGDDHVVFVKSDYNFIIMNSFFEPLYEANLFKDGFGTEEFVNVGWGKKETQFHGSQGKDAALKLKEETTPVYDWDDKSINVSWRGDGELFVTSAVNPQTLARQLRVWNKEGILQFSSEAYNGLAGALGWRPSGNLIAVSRCSPPLGLHVQFFEKNCLTHGEFSVRAIEGTTITKLMWNCTSDLLLVVLTETSDPDRHTVQVWNTGNYHWYLKWSLNFDSLAAICWSDSVWSQLYLLSYDGDYKCFNFRWGIDKSLCVSSTDESLVAVIDGRCLLMTPFCLMVVPPPMSAFTLSFDSNIMQVSFSYSLEFPNVAVVSLSNGTVYLVVPETLASSMGLQHHVDGHYNLAFDQGGGNGFKQKCTKHLPLLIKVKIPYSEETLIHLISPRRLLLFNTVSKIGRLIDNIFEAEPEYKTFDLSKSMKYTETLTHFYELSSVIYCQSNKGHVFILELEFFHLCDFSQNICNSEWCHQFAVTTIGGDIVITKLSDSYKLHLTSAFEHFEVKKVNSFVIHSHFLLVTTLSHDLLSADRSRNLEHVHKILTSDHLVSLAVGDSETSRKEFSEYSRALERGSQLVTTIAEGTLVILQMPRGNLEGIHPRSLVLRQIRSLLEKNVYSDAYEIMRKHRINLNLFYDHSPNDFMQNIATFVTSINNADYMNLFISELDEDDVTSSMYSGFYKDLLENRSLNRANIPTDIASKIDGNTSKIYLVCQCVLSQLEKTNFSLYFTSILSCWVKLKQTEKALTLIFAQQKKADTAHLFETGFKHLLYLCNVNDLYNTAIGTYNLDITLMVAQKSQKDPKDYLMFLQNLAKMPEDYRRAKIDIYLRRFESAISNLAVSGEEYFEECFRLAQEHKLYGLLLEKLSKQNIEKYQLVSNAFAENVKLNGQLDFAGHIFMQAEVFDKAVECFRASLNSKLWLTASMRYGVDEKELRQTAMSLAVRLKEVSRFSEAIELITFFDDLNDEEQDMVVDLTINGSLWENGLLLCAKFNKLETVTTKLQPALLASCSDEIKLINDSLTTLKDFKSRLLDIRQKREIRAVGSFGDIGADSLFDQSDAFSEISTVVSTAVSRSSGRTSKSRRKAKSHFLSTKVGHPREELGLLSALHDLFLTFSSKHFGSRCKLLSALISSGAFSRARSLLEALRELVIALAATQPLIWPVSPQTMITAATSFDTLPCFFCSPDIDFDKLKNILVKIDC